MDEAVRYEDEHGADASSRRSRCACTVRFSPIRPASGTRPARRSLAHFTPAQIVELAFKFFWWSTNRATVTLGDDAPHDADRLTSFHYDEDGAYVVHAPD